MRTGLPCGTGLLVPTLYLPYAPTVCTLRPYFPTIPTYGPHLAVRTYWRFLLSVPVILTSGLGAYLTYLGPLALLLLLHF
jgi:hypothetical protein